MTLGELAVGLAIALIFESLYYTLLYGQDFGAYMIAASAIFYFSIILGILISKYLGGLIR